jgi:hypothetical protein
MYVGIITRTMLGRDSSVGTATRYGLNGPGIESLPSGLRLGSASDRLLGLRFESRRGHGCLCCVSSVKTSKVQDSQDKDTSTDEVQTSKIIQKNPGVGEIIATRRDRPWGPPSLLYNGYRVSFPGVKRPGRGVNHPPPSSAEAKESYTSTPPLGLHDLF